LSLLIICRRQINTGVSPCVSYYLRLSDFSFEEELFEDDDFDLFSAELLFPFGTDDTDLEEDDPREDELIVRVCVCPEPEETDDLLPDGC
jgi:hypothetical protein